MLCTDKPNSLDLRMKVRPDHLAFLNSLGTALKAAGPFTTDEGSPIGTLAIIEAAFRPVQDDFRHVVFRFSFSGNVLALMAGLGPVILKP